VIAGVKNGLFCLSSCFAIMIAGERFLFFVAMYNVSVLLKCFKYAKDKLDFKSFAAC